MNKTKDEQIAYWIEQATKAEAENKYLKDGWDECVMLLNEVQNKDVLVKMRKEIADLKAEIDRYKKGGLAISKIYKARAEKAEAENEKSEADNFKAFQDGFIAGQIVAKDTLEGDCTKPNHIMHEGNCQTCYLEAPGGDL